MKNEVKQEEFKLIKFFLPTDKPEILIKPDISINYLTKPLVSNDNELYVCKYIHSEIYLVLHIRKISIK